MSKPLERAAARETTGSARVFAALGDETRLRLVRRLSSGGPLSIHRLTEGSALTRQAVTKHLLVLARAGLVQGSRRGRERLWRLEPDPLAAARQWLDAVSARWDAALERLRRAVEEPESASIRAYREDDLEAVLAAWENASRGAHAFLGPEHLARERHQVAEVHLRQADTWVAELDGRVVGFVALVGNEVGGLFVEPAFQGRGVGRALMDKARELHGELEVEVFEANRPARRFYAAYGFEPQSARLHETGHRLVRLRHRAAVGGSANRA